MKKTGLLVLVGLLLIACHGTKDSQLVSEEVQEDQAVSLSVKDIQESIPALKIGTLQRKILKQNIKCTGRVEVPHFEMHAVHSKSEGIVQSMKYIPGDYVKKGAVLFKITNPELIEKQRVFLETKALLTLANKELVRKEFLQKENATSQKSLDEASSTKELLTAKYAGLKNELNVLGINVKALEEEQSFQSQIFVRAARSGYIHKVLVNNGQMISPHDRLMEIANNSHIHLELQVLSKDVSKLKVGQHINFTLPNNPKRFSANIEKLNPMIDPETGTLNVHCHIAKEDLDDIVIGMFVNAEIEVDSIEVQGLPLDAVVKEGSEYFAYVVENDRFKKQILQDIKLYDEFVSFSGLTNDQLVIAGAYYVE
jgi:cobalt-zinc-cadmium efflux system membrane fusion protein